MFSRKICLKQGFALFGRNFFIHGFMRRDDSLLIIKKTASGKSPALFWRQLLLPDSTPEA